MLVPKLITTLKDYSRAQFVTDLAAGVIVGIVALPLAIAFGIASGVTPEAGLVTAIIAGLVVSALGGSRVQIGGPSGAFVVANVSASSREFDAETAVDTPLYTQGRKVPKGVQIYAIDGPFFFGAAEKFKQTLTQVAGKPRVVVLLMRNVSAIDSTGLRALQEVVKQFRSGGTEVLLAGVHAQPMVAIARAGIIDLLGEDNLVGTIDQALDRASRVMQ